MFIIVKTATWVGVQNSLHFGQPSSYQYPALAASPQPTARPGSSSGGQNSPSPFDLLRALSLQADIPLQRAAVPPMCAGGVAGGGASRNGSPPLYNDFSLSADLFATRPWTALNTLCATSASDPYSIERAAKLYRNAASQYTLLLHALVASYPYALFNIKGAFSSFDVFYFYYAYSKQPILDCGWSFPVA